MKTFYLGCSHPDWLEKTSVPLFVSRASFYKKGVRRKSFPRALGPWALDSGGFSELKKHGKWTVSPEQYVEDVQVFQAEVGKLRWAPCQDWMTEEDQLARTGFSVKDHQRLTLDNYLKLLDLAPKLPWVPVLQGWAPFQYDDHWKLYESAGIKLEKLPLVGIGSVCRRQDTLRAGMMMQDFAERGLKLHGFGFKTGGLLTKSVRDALVSADSMSWSLEARFDRHRRCRGGSHPNTQKCNNCIYWATEWRDDLMDRISQDDRRYQR